MKDTPVVITISWTQQGIFYSNYFFLNKDKEPTSN